MAFSDLAREFFQDIRGLDLGSKICLASSWVIGGSAVLLIGSATITVCCWGLGKDVPPVVKKSLFLGLGGSVGGFLFINGAISETERQDDLELERIRAEKNSQDAKKLRSMCVYCNFHHDSAYLSCAIHPTKVYTDAAKNCPDFED